MSLTRRTDSRLRGCEVGSLIDQSAPIAPEDATRRLAVYGSLAPGESNHHLLDGMTGRWTRGFVLGELHDRGWGARQGFPGLVCRHDAGEIAVQVFESHDLPANWTRLDTFEGAEYGRVKTSVRLPSGARVVAQIYALRAAHP